MYVKILTGPLFFVGQLSPYCGDDSVDNGDGTDGEANGEDAADDDAEDDIDDEAVVDDDVDDEYCADDDVDDDAHDTDYNIGSGGNDDVVGD